VIETLVKGLLIAAPFAIVAAFWVMAVRERRAANDPSAKGFLERNGWAIALYLIVAVGFWAIVMIVLPQLYMIDFSFHPKLPPKDYGGPNDHYTLDSYRYFLFASTESTASWNVVHLRAFVLTIVASIGVTFFSFCFCYPLAYYLAQVAGPSRLRLLMLLLIVPFWVNEILRAFALRILFGTSGLLNNLLIALGLLAEPIDFLGIDVALYTGLAYAYLLLMMFPLYNAIESLDKNQIEAARDLGAPWWHIHANVVMPFAKPGIASGCTMVFMLSAGALAAPQILGGPNTLWFTPIVYDRFYQAFNWPQGSAYAFILLLTCIVFVLAVLKVFKVSLGEITR
jgi:spermidine/putrescine transport system permease protein